MREGLRSIEDMNRSLHVIMNQTNELEITRSGETNRESLSFDEGRAGYAGRAIEAGGTRRKARASDKEIGALLVGLEKGDSVNVTGVECPGDAVTGMDPDFIGKKCQRR